MILTILKKIFLLNAGYTYSNLSRFFLRMFTGVMLLQFSIRQIIHFHNTVQEAYTLFGLAEQDLLILVVVVEVICATFIILGLFCRFALLPPLALMLLAERVILQSTATQSSQLFNFQPGYPIMFLGIFVYLILAGPGKISVDYLLALHLTQEDDNHADEKLLEEA